VKRAKPHSGSIPPIPTFLNGDCVDAKRQCSLLNRLAAAGVDGILTLGTVGEGAVLDEAIRVGAIRAAVRCLPEKAVIVGCFGHTAKALLQQVETAADSGATAALVTPPFYFRLSQVALLDLLTEVADRASIPVVLYHIPTVTGNPLSSELVERVADHPNVAGIKDSGGDFAHFLKLHRQHASKDFVVFQGTAALVGPSILAGCLDAMCTVTALVPHLEMNLRRAVKTADLAPVPALLRRISAIAELFRLGDYPIPANFKLVAELLELGSARVHDPALSPSVTHREEMKRKMSDLALFNADDSAQSVLERIDHNKDRG